MDGYSIHKITHIDYLTKSRVLTGAAWHLTLYRSGDDVDNLAVATHTELHGAIGEGEQRVILAHADVVARVEVGATLANDDVAGHDGFAAKLLHAEVLRVRIATVARLDAPFLCAMIHGPFYNSGNRRDLDDSQLLAMTLTASNTSLVLVLLDANLRALGFVVHNLSLDGHFGQIGGGKG